MVAPREVVPIIMNLVKPGSVLDVGSGIGTWLKAFEEAGVQNYCGLDGDYVDRSQLKIPTEKFIPIDLGKSWSLHKKFDLVISLEVAEHLPESSADTFVDSLTSHGDVILFSAAIPGQGGQRHINEQWPEYWQKKFARHGFYFHDIVRPMIWNNENVNWWYRQNIFLINKDKNQETIMPLVHPELFNQKLSNEKSYQESLLRGEQGVRSGTTIFFNSLLFKLKNFFQ